MAQRQGREPLWQFQRNLLNWFRRNRRELPWRRSRDSYRVWVSEVMLQQTRTAAVLPYYNRFFRAFPSIASLARARSERVLRAWSGLGYYNRARNLHRAAQVVVRSHRGRFPSEFDAALALPGVGHYIARAVLSIAYGRPLAVLDGNVARVIGRREAIEGDLRESMRWKQLQAIADRWLSREAPGDWNQAMMELGATICTPRRPYCGSCPVRKGCKAFRLGIADRLPERRAKLSPKRLAVAAAVLVDREGRTLLVRPPKSSAANDSGPTGDMAALFSRMWQFPALVANSDSLEQLRRYIAVEFGLSVRSCHPLAKLRHTVTYREITIEPWLFRVEQLSGAALSRVAALDRVPAMAISSASRKIALAAIAALPAAKIKFGDSQR